MSIKQDFISERERIILDRSLNAKDDTTKNKKGVITPKESDIVATIDQNASVLFCPTSCEKVDVIIGSTKLPIKVYDSGRMHELGVLDEFYTDNCGNIYANVKLNAHGATLFDDTKPEVSTVSCRKENDN
jgi:hypothetical protein